MLLLIPAYAVDGGATARPVRKTHQALHRYNNQLNRG